MNVYLKLKPRFDKSTPVAHCVFDKPTLTPPVKECLFIHILSAQPRKQCVSLLNYATCSPMMVVSSVCSCVPSLLQAICVGPENLQVMYPAIFEQLLLFVEFSCKPPQYGRMETKHVANAKYNQVRGGEAGP